MLESALEVTVGGGDVRFSFTVVNAGDTAVELTFRDACRADFAVYEDGRSPGPAGTDDGPMDAPGGEGGAGGAGRGEEVWRYSDGRAFAQVLTTAELQPGETATFAESWPDPEPGHFTAEATLRVREGDVTARTPFSV